MSPVADILTFIGGGGQKYFGEERNFYLWYIGVSAYFGLALLGADASTPP